MTVLAISPPRIFVFGSNLAGRHGAGGALWASQHRGAIRGQGEGLQNQSYAIPTKDRQLQPLPLYTIEGHVRKFIEFAKMQPELEFELTAIGCGRAGYRPWQIAPMFRGAPSNVHQPQSFVAINKTELGK